MTFEVDNDALKRAMMRHYEEKLAKELREMFVFGANQDTQRIWQFYMEEITRQEEERKTHRREFWHTFMIIVGVAITAYSSYRLWTL